MRRPPLTESSPARRPHAPLQVSPNDSPDAVAVRLAGVSARRGSRQVLHEVTLDVQRGSVTGILGHNGAGKSSLLGLILGLHPLTAGQAWVLGRPLPVKGPELRRLTGVVLQETALYDELNAIENLRFAAALYGVQEPDRRIAEVLELLSLADRRDQLVGTLSGGLRRRLAVARGLLHEPELLVIDEPTLGVDAEARHAIWAHVRMIRARGTTVVVATNYLDEVEALCDVAAVLHEGRLVANESPADLVARAGQCIDVQCDSENSEATSAFAAGLPGVTRSEVTPSGFTIYLGLGKDPEPVVKALFNRGALSGFRTRAADLAEVFRSLAEPKPG